MKAILTALFLCSLTSCEVVYGAWGWAYHHQGGWPERQKPTNPTPEEAEANLKAVQHLATHL